MSKAIIIPSTIEEAVSSLNGIAALLTAKGWERAAIVRAFTYEGKPGPKIARESARLTIADFARLGINGLKAHESVRSYRQAWQSAIDAGEAVEPEPGKRVELPTSEFPPTRSGTDGYSSEEGAAKTIERIIARHGPEPVRQVITRNREVMNIARQEAAEADRQERAMFSRCVSDFDAKSETYETVAERLRPSSFDRAIRDVHSIGLALRALRDAMSEMSREERSEVAEALGVKADLARMLADAYQTEDIDAELAALLGSESSNEE